MMIVGAVAVLAAGCQKEEIERYSAAREERTPLFPADPATRLLGALAPHGDSTWFFKLVGPVKAVEEQRGTFFAFLRSVRLEGDGPVWKLPPGWAEEKGPEPRFATLRLGPKDAPLELTVSRLGREGEAGSVLANVNRWRRLDLGLTRPLHKADLAAVTKTEEIGGVAFTVVDMGGYAVSKRAMPGGPARKPSLRYEAPEGWQAVPGDQGMIRAEAAFRVAGEGGRADVTVTALPGAAGGVAENVNRWRGQVGLKRLPDDELRRELRAVTVDGRAGEYADLTGARDRILAAILPRGDRTWFVKMTGPSALVEKHKAAFEKFLASLRFDGGTGANDG